MSQEWMPQSAYLPLMRKHVMGPDWVRQPGTDFWVMPGLVAGAAASTANIEQLVEGGWIGTDLVDTVGGGGDLLSADDVGIPNHFLTDGSGDLLRSPSIFGDHAHALQAQRIAGMTKLPTDLILEFKGAMTVHSADEPTSGWGFLEDVGAASSEAAQLAFISSDSSNFQLASNAGAGALTDAGAADDAAWHVFKIRLNRADALAYWYIDDVRQGSVAITGDEVPAAFGFHALSTNRPGLGWAHIYYDWDVRS